MTDRKKIDEGNTARNSSIMLSPFSRKKHIKTTEKYFMKNNNIHVATKEETHSLHHQVGGHLLWFRLFVLMK